VSARLKAIARRAASGAQGALRSRIEALPRLLQTPANLSCSPPGERFFYIDRENGSDVTGEGSKEKPFRSGERAAAVCKEKGYRIVERGWGP